MPAATLAKSATPLSTTSSVVSNPPTSNIQNGPYTKAQFQSTMEGSRSIKNMKEIEQLLHDYPAALELYRTGKYKVKVKYEADVERVILVEKRSSKMATNNDTTAPTNVVTASDKNSSANVEKPTRDEARHEKGSIQSRSRPQSQDRLGTNTAVTNAANTVHTTTTSMRMSTNSQPKVDNHRAPSKDRDISVSSQSKQQSQSQSQPTSESAPKPPLDRRSQSRESPSIVSHTKRHGRRSHRDQGRMLVPFVNQGNPLANMWNQQQALQPYYSNPLLAQQRNNIYMPPPPYVPSQNPLFPQQFSYGPQAPHPLTYQQPVAFHNTSALKSTANATNNTLHSARNYQSSSRSIANSNHAVGFQPTYQSFYPNQPTFRPPVPPSQSIYQSQIPYPIPMQWPGNPSNVPFNPMTPNYTAYADQRRTSKNRARSVDTGPRGRPPVQPQAPQQPAFVPQQKSQPTVPVVEHAHYHRHHHHRSHLSAQNVPVHSAVPVVEVPKESTTLPKEAQTAPGPTTTNAEKLTIRQLNEMFTQADASGRLPYGQIPNVLQRFGISLAENDLTSAARELNYNVMEPVSARRLVHVLVKLGKIAKSSHQQQQQRSAASPSMLPEDREVTDILTQRQVPSHTMYGSYPQHWH